VSQEEITKGGKQIVIGLKRNGEMVAKKNVSIDLGNQDFAEYFSSNSLETEYPSMSKKNCLRSAQALQSTNWISQHSKNTIIKPKKQKA
jgi:hypothetical protein